jgi:trehalose-6-phosphate synthase
MEFVSVKAAQDKFDKSSCIVSEFSGCARALGGAFTINPYNVEEIASKIYESIDIQALEKKQRMQ